MKKLWNVAPLPQPPPQREWEKTWGALKEHKVNRLKLNLTVVWIVLISCSERNSFHTRSIPPTFESSYYSCASFSPRISSIDSGLKWSASEKTGAFFKRYQRKIIWSSYTMPFLRRLSLTEVCRCMFAITSWRISDKVKMVRIYGLDDVINFEFVFRRFISF